MVESATILTLCMLYLIFFRPGKTPPLENPLVIERPGQYHMTLASHLNLAQPFIEALVKRMGASGEVTPDSQTKYFEVRDKHVKAHGYNFYLLAVTRRNGMLFFQAARPLSKEPGSQIKTISEFSHGVLARFPGDDGQDAGEDIAAEVQEVAQKFNIQITAL